MRPRFISSLVLCSLGFFVIGFYARYWYVHNFRGPFGADLISIRAAEGRYQFINPLLGCDFERRRDFAELLNVKKAVSQRVLEGKESASIVDASVYFRNLDNGHWFGIQQDEKFVPASLFKVPIMISVLKLAEGDPDLLNRKIKLDRVSSAALNQNVKPELRVNVNSYYTVNQLLEYMIRYSDNRALELLLTLVDDGIYREILSDLGIDYETSLDPNKPNFLTAKTYALLFRVLRNATYLSREFSEKALELLSKTEFEDGLEMGIGDPDITVAHKFGEREMIFEGEKMIELHDCGIIYHPDDPYLACVMTRGKSLNDLKKVIQEISGIIYDYVERRGAFKL